MQPSLPYSVAEICLKHFSMKYDVYIWSFYILLLLLQGYANLWCSNIFCIGHLTRTKIYLNEYFRELYGYLLVKDRKALKSNVLCGVNSLLLKNKNFKSMIKSRNLELVCVFCGNIGSANYLTILTTWLGFFSTNEVLLFRSI